MGAIIDKTIKKIEKEINKTEKSLKHLKKADKKRDKICAAGKKALEKKHAKKR